MSRVYGLLALSVVLLGCLHMAATFRLSSATPAGKVWFFGSGMAIALVGVMNLLNRRYGASAWGLRAACAGANLAMTGLAVVAGGVTSASLTQRILMTAALSSLLVLGSLPSALRAGSD